ncbi:MAG: hypothetical protein FJ037_01740 [Chloroflexi bacterium]|nr:hypothetical protein [Chloroflexota bacterium]
MATGAPQHISSAHLYGYDDAPNPAARAPPTEATAPQLLTFRAPSGIPFVLEVRATQRWDNTLLNSPAVDVADVRAVVLAAPDSVPPQPPGWLAIILNRPPAAWGGVAQGLWPASPHYREHGPSEAEFRAAGVAALRHASARVEVVDPIAIALADTDTDTEALPLHGAALERWLHVHFRTSEQFATVLLTRQIGECDPETAAALRFLDDAAVPEAGGWADLAFDRQVLLEQATPWRYFDRTFAPALAALAIWRRRYDTAYARHYAMALADAARTRGGAEQLLARAATADRLASILASGRRLIALHVRGAVDALGTLPPAPLPGQPVTGDIRLGAGHPAVATLEELRGEVEEALDTRLRALSTALTHRVLDGAGDDLARVLTAIHASDVGNLDRVLDDRLAALLTRVVRGFGGDDPLADVAARFPEVRADDVDAVAEAFRGALAAAVHGAPDGVARLS